ncbi:MAG: cAMP-binding protein [Rhodospirillaceae bacterium]|nr:MAG: cAMP-binding protein [Rhodospirillaceae bacterium]
MLSTAANKRETFLGTVGAGDFFGELAAIDGKERSARVTAVKDCLIAVLPGENFLALLDTHAPLAVRVMKRLAFVIRILDNRVTELSALSASQRVILKLLQIAQPDLQHATFWIITVLPEEQEIAQWAGTSREIVVRILNELIRADLVERAVREAS